MFSLGCVRLMCTSTVLQRSNWLIMNRCESKAAAYATQRNRFSLREDRSRSYSTVEYSTQLKRREIIYKCNLEPLRTYCVKLKPSCWNCKQPIEKTPVYFCSTCKVIQPPDESSSYFQIMDCNCSFMLDLRKLQKRYLQLQRALHPDNFSQKTVKEQEYSESQSAFVNKAYQTLLKPLNRGLYMLELKGMHIEEGTDPGADPQLLMELMEINESLDEAQTLEEAGKIGQSMKDKLTDLKQKIDAALCKGELQTAKALLVQMKYFGNIEEKVKEKLSRLM